MIVHSDVDSLLRAHRLEAVAEVPFTHTGFSGATLTRLTRADTTFVLKRMAITRDWIMRATNDESCREVELAAAAPELGPQIRTPAVGVARDRDGFALLMHDVTPDLIAPSAISRSQLETIIEHMAELHRITPPNGIVGWCDVNRRLTLLTPQTASIAAAYGAPVADDIVGGWKLFATLAPTEVARLIDRLQKDASVLLRALEYLPAAFLHGDLKLDNIGLAPDGRMWLIDWALTVVAPPAVELGWFLAINSRRLPVSLGETMSMYADAARIPPASREGHDRLTILCGLLLRGWRKALDAHEGEPEELRWWCAKAEEAAVIL